MPKYKTISKSLTQKSPFYSCPEKFLHLGQRVRAKIRVWDLPGNVDQGPIRAEPGGLGTVVHVQEGRWPTVTFDEGGAGQGGSTCVGDSEVEPVEAYAQRLADFFEGLRTGLLYPLNPPDATDLARSQGFCAGAAFVTDVLTGEAPGLTITDFIETALKDLDTL